MPGKEKLLEQLNKIHQDIAEIRDLAVKADKRSRACRDAVSRLRREIAGRDVVQNDGDETP